MKTADLFYSTLREQVLITSGIETICLRVCGEICIKIFEKDKNYISENSIKSFFGLLSYINPPCPFVLDSLARFIGYAGWDNFKQKSIINTDLRNAGIEITFTGDNNPVCAPVVNK